VNHGLIPSFHHSKPESATGIHIYWLNHRRSWIFAHGFQSVLWFFFWFKSLFWWNFYGFVGLQRLIHVVNPKILHGFEKKLGFHSFLNRTFWIRMDPCWFSLADVYAYEGGKFLWFLTWFCSEIQSWTFRLLRCWFCCWFWDWNPEINRDPSFFFLTGSEPLNSSLSSSFQTVYVIAPDSLLLAMDLALELQKL